MSDMIYVGDSDSIFHGPVILLYYAASLMASEFPIFFSLPEPLGS